MPIKRYKTVKERNAFIIGTLNTMLLSLGILLTTNGDYVRLVGLILIILSCAVSLRYV